MAPLRKFIGAVMVSLAAVSPLPSSAGSKELATELLEIYDVPATARMAVSTMIDTLTTQDAHLRPYAGIVRDFANQRLTWPNLREGIVKEYTTTFSEQELRDLVEFFKSPTGKKFIQASPGLSQRVGSSVQRVLVEYQKELDKMIVEQELRGFDKIR
ncbi:MAG: DUF2059 domain-containing protein [Hydrogenophilales bacterium]|nr:DUF2059 domain-containing protein [Hydrogenophilales bacterium]